MLDIEHVQYLTYLLEEEKDKQNEIDLKEEESHKRKAAEYYPIKRYQKFQMKRRKNSAVQEPSPNEEINS